MIKPRRPLAPSIPNHIQLSRAQLDAGESWESFRARWEAFARPDDLLCAWGRYPLDVLESEGLPLPSARLDVRPTAGTYFGTRVGVLEKCAERLGVPIPDPFAPGRGGVRLSALSAIVDRMLELTPDAA